MKDFTEVEKIVFTAYSAFADKHLPVHSGVDVCATLTAMVLKNLGSSRSPVIDRASADVAQLTKARILELQCDLSPLIGRYNAFCEAALQLAGAGETSELAAGDRILIEATVAEDSLNEFYLELEGRGVIITKPKLIKKLGENKT